MGRLVGWSEDSTGYRIGSSFTVADLNVASVLSWAKMGDMDFSAYLHVD